MRDIIKLLEKDGWHLMRIRGGHRRYKHPFKNGLLTVCGNLGDDVARNPKYHIEAERPEGGGRR
ncbi:type II toxin-antitoxin system HicA family toxin [Candidatus Methanocrinis natronophilus]|uniref:Type II toxin-antitoxin system HicA family toxin n=1 Tax=Candidatus Methanocrinis natronophilus TaxID=3033396 RepID=A0ABT5X792_9EURY|nr:type II toxin-antitoxin system HicA family toxin [Candidatus Methanocrinis natronophilus]MDF0590557.1 type II toxin-antitoxin system HicA family toxin [Candidatus Methanocrinis natronophilus]